MGGADHFERTAGTYASARPPYPAQLFDHLMESGVIGRGQRILEIGAGTGQATGELVERGCIVTAIESGAKLAEHLKAAVPSARVIRAPVESVDLPTSGFDGVVAASSMHWVDLPATLQRLHKTLAAGGTLAVWRAIFGDPRVRTPFRDAVAAVVAWREVGGCPRNQLDPRPTVAGLEVDGWFDHAETWIHPWQVDLETAQIERLFETFSDWSAAEVEAVGNAARQLGSTIREHYLTHLHLLRRSEVASRDGWMRDGGRVRYEAMSTDKAQILHNPRCSKSRAALAEGAGHGVELEVINYLDEPLSERALLELLAKLEDPPSALVRRDPLFKELGLTGADIETPEQVAALLAQHPRLMERPVLVRGERAIIGRPTERAVLFLREE